MSNSQDSVRDRILAAARAELAAYGAAGARVSRIATRAQTSKERLYAYFRTKQELLEAVMVARYASFTVASSLDAQDLPGFVGRIFDHYAAHPEDLRLTRWSGLELPGGALPADDPRILTLQATIATIAAGQAAGHVDASWNPADLWYLLLGIAVAWSTTPDFVHQLLAGQGGLAARRAAAVEAARRLVTPR